MHALLARDDLAGARRRLSHLAGRDPDGLGPDELARATVESVAENTSDAVVAPLLWGAVAGVPGLLGYRAVNTLDAMVGHRSPRYARFGWAAARLDDAGEPGAGPGRRGPGDRCAAPAVGGRPAAAVRAWRRDAGRHPSPNAGPVEAAFAGALGRPARRRQPSTATGWRTAAPSATARRRGWPTSAGPSGCPASSAPAGSRSPSPPSHSGPPGSRTMRDGNCSSPAPPPTPARAWSPRASAGGWPGRACGWRRSRRRTCRTTRWSAATAPRSAGRSGCRRWPPARSRRRR